MHRRTSAERYVAFGRLSAHQDADSSLGQQWSIRHVSLRLTDNFKFEVQSHAGLMLNCATHYFDQSDHIGCSRMSAVDDKISVLGRYFRISDAQTLQTRRLEQTTGRIIGRILENTAGTGHRERLGVPPIMEVVFDDFLDFRSNALSQLKPNSHHDALRQTCPPVFERDRRS